MKKIMIGALALSIIFYGCGGDTPPAPVPKPPEPEPVAITAKDVGFKASFHESFENTVYPSVILGYAGFSSTQNKSLELIKYKVKSPKDNARLKIELKSSTINQSTIFRNELGTKGTESTFTPKINWDFEKLKRLDQPGTVNLSFVVSIDDKEIDNVDLRLNYRSVNECVFGGVLQNGKAIITADLFAAYVNEDHPKIDEFLREVLATKIVNRFLDYQDGTVSSVVKQVFAVWYTLQKQGIKYSNIPNTSNRAEKIYSQYVRFFEQVYKNKQANCVDGSVFLCSILEKIGIKTFLILEPAHMYMGFYTSNEQSINDRSYVTLETTAIGSDLINDFDYYYPKLPKKTTDDFIAGRISLEDYEKAISYVHFVDITQQRTDKHQSIIPKLLDDTEQFYQGITIEEARKKVKPIGR